jgi:hypothetical protein
LWIGGKHHDAQTWAELSREVRSGFPRATADKCAVRATKKIFRAFAHIPSEAFPPALHNFRTSFCGRNFSLGRKGFPLLPREYGREKWRKQKLSLTRQHFTLDISSKEVALTPNMPWRDQTSGLKA